MPKPTPPFPEKPPTHQKRKAHRVKVPKTPYDLETLPVVTYDSVRGMTGRQRQMGREVCVKKGQHEYVKVVFERTTMGALVFCRRCGELVTWRGL